MRAGIRSRWEFSDAADWITAIAEIERTLVFVGTRDGKLFILNRLGGLIEQIECGSWVGAIKAIELGRDAPRAMRGIHLFVGTKLGMIRCLRLREAGSEPVRVEETFRFHAGHTVRDIDLVEVPGDVWIAAGTEGRHVYRFNLSEILARRHAVPVTHVRLNGWIRSVAFAFGSVSEPPIVAAGCGDRNLYLISEQDFLAGEAADPPKVPMDAKINAILADARTSRIFCASDAKQLLVVTRAGSSRYRVQHVHRLPHRATHLAFASQRRERILVACEDEAIYAYDAARHALGKCIPVREPVFALSGSAGDRDDRLLLGFDGRMACCAYTAARIARAAGGSIAGDLDGFVPDDFAVFARTLLAGPKRRGIEVGTGRFLHLTPALNGVPPTCVAGTDEGDVVVLQLDGADLVELHRESLKPARVWSVDSEWLGPDRLHIRAATSDDEITSLEIGLDGEQPAVDRLDPVVVDDWPREIRRVEGDAARLVACCENGDLLVVGDPPVRIETKQTLRTCIARSAGDADELLTGSDEGLVTRFSGTALRWQHRTLDRVREVLMHDDVCIAVSEDRFLYVWDDDGTLRWRYRFPHRALCVDVLIDAGACSFVVGCGDGHVYLLDDGGAVTASYAFPDRIRDVKAVDGPAGPELLVACEDGKVYRAPTVETFMTEHYGEPPGPVSEQVDALRDAEEVADLSKVVRIALLGDIESWFLPADDELAISLLDASESDVLASRSPHWSAIYARALVWATLRIDVEAGRSRIESFLRAARSNAYAQEATLSSIRALGAPGSGADPSSWRPMVETIVVNVAIDDDWIRERLLDQLEAARFLMLGGDGFRRWFRHVPIGFDALAAILDAAARSSRPELADSPVVELLAFLAEPTQDAVRFDCLRSLIASHPGQRADRIVLSHMRKLEELLFAPDWKEHVPVDWLLRWVKRRISSPEAVDVIHELLDRFGPGPEDPARTYGLLADLICERMFRSACRISADDLLAIHFACGFVRALGARRAKESAEAPSHASLG